MPWSFPRFLDRREYEVESRSMSVLTAKTTAESINSIVDGEGKSQVLFKEIIDHRKDNSALSKDDAFLPETNVHISYRW